MGEACLMCPLELCDDVKSPEYDGVVLILDNIERLTGPLQFLYSTIQDYCKLDGSAEVAVVACAEIPSKRLIYVPTGPVTRDHDDVRLYQEAALKGIQKAIAAGCKKPLVVGPRHEKYPLAGRVAFLGALHALYTKPLVVGPRHEKYPLAGRVAFLGALHALYTPIEVREALPQKALKVEKCGVWMADNGGTELAILQALESGRVVCRDIGGSDPERMAAPKVTQYVRQVFKDTCVNVDVISDLSVLEAEYPLLAAVNRASRFVPRHAPNLIFLEYEGKGPIDTTLILVGKGITYDTGGADLKVSGAMAGMHRDKCGAAAVAGFFKTLSIYKPQGLKVIGTMSMVRNSIGPESYVSDEIITSRAGVRVRIGNTDAEGRMVMADVLCQMKERAVNEINPLLFTVATLTGHVIRAFGENYSGVVENGPARQAHVAQTLFQAGERSGDPFEISTLRREDYELHAGKSEYEDVVQAGGKPSTQTDRGHQAPTAFLVRASGLDKHGGDSERPLPYSHLDVAGSSGPFPGIPTGAPLVALAHAYVLDRKSSAA